MSNNKLIAFFGKTLFYPSVQLELLNSQWYSAYSSRGCAVIAGLPGKDLLSTSSLPRMEDSF